MIKTGKHTGTGMAPVHVANDQVGRGHRQLPLELYLTFPDLNNKLFTNTDGEGGHSWKSLAIICNIFHVVFFFFIVSRLIPN